MCELCSLINSDRVVGGDENIVVIVPHTMAPAAIVVPRQHGPMHEQPANVQEKLFSTANTLSSLIFDNLGMHGTNVILTDAAHAGYTIIGRTEQDGLDLRWKPTAADKSELAETAKKISEQMWYIGKDRPTSVTQIQNSAAPPASASELPPVTKESLAPRDVATKISQPIRKGPKDENSYLIKQLTRRR